MPTLWVGNFSFEEELQGKFQRSQKLQRFESELAPCLIAAMNPDDYLLCPESLDNAFLEKFSRLGLRSANFVAAPEISTLAGKVNSITPWGWTDAVGQLATQLGVKQTSPTVESVFKVNSRKFSFDLSQRLKCQVMGECEVQSLEELELATQQHPSPDGWILKQEFGQAGRGQSWVRDGQLNDAVRSWVLKRLKMDGLLFLEPILKPIVEFGVQWDIPLQGSPGLLGFTVLASSSHGGYESSIVRPELEHNKELKKIIEFQTAAIRETQATGYFGPVGIDAMVFLNTDQKRCLRPIQDVNARWTMGRLAMCWAGVCFPDESKVQWSHQAEPPTAEAIRTSPEFVGGQPVRHATWCHR